MYPGYWEDYMNDGTPDPDNIRNVYEIEVKGVKFSSLQKAYNSAIHIQGDSLANATEKIRYLKEIGAIVKRRHYNDTQKRWEDTGFETL